MHASEEIARQNNNSTGREKHALESSKQSKNNDNIKENSSEEEEDEYEDVLLETESNREEHSYCSNEKDQDLHFCPYCICTSMSLIYKGMFK